MGVTELGPKLGNDPNMAVSVLYGLGTWEAGRSGGGMDPHHRGWVRVGEGRGSSNNSSSTTTNTNSGGNPPPRPPKTSPATSRVAGKKAPPENPIPSPSPSPSPRSSPPPPPKPHAPTLAARGRDPYGNVPWAVGGNGGTVSQVMVLGDWDEELDPGDWWVVS